jgi:tetratricopeptide (TPR) repeat protein
MAEGKLVKYLLSLGEEEQAQQTLNDAIARSLEEVFETSNCYANQLDAVSEFLIEAGYIEMAEPMLQESLQIWCRYPLDEGFGKMSAWVRAMLGHCLASMMRYAEAEKKLLEGYGRMDGNPVVFIQRQHQTLEWIVKLYKAWGKPEKAAEWCQKLPPHMR